MLMQFGMRPAFRTTQIALSVIAFRVAGLALERTSDRMGWSATSGFRLIRPVTQAIPCESG